MSTDAGESASMRTIEAIDSRRRKAATKALDISLNELADMYLSRELVIRPEYQRLFRWSNEKQSQFIESLILEMPIPPIFTIETEEGKWELIDGLQRLSTYLHFRGVLDAPDKRPEPIEKGDELQLIGCDILKELNETRFAGLPSTIQIRLKRSFLRVEVVRRESDPRFRYYMFKRLNTGGEQLTEQEVRNCTIRLLGNTFNDFLIRLAQETSFKAAIASLSDADKERMGDVELVLRFFTFKNHLDKFEHGIAEFLTEYMEGVTDTTIPFDYQREESQFKRTFALLNDALGENTCQRWIGDKFGGGFSMHHFEVFTIGLARIIDSVSDDDHARRERLRAALVATKKDDALKAHTQGGGKNSPGLYKAKLDFVEGKLRAAL